MTKLSYRFLCAVLLAATLGGGSLLAPMPLDFGYGSVACDAWFADPQPGPITLTGCVVDLIDVSAGSEDEGPVQEAVLAVRPPGGGDADGQLPDLTFISLDTTHVRLALHMDSMRERDPDALARFQERHRAELVQIADISGRSENITSASEGDRLIVVEEGPPSPLRRAFGIVLLLFGLLGLLVLVPLQRKWTRNRLRLTGKGKPLSF